MKICYFPYSDGVEVAMDVGAAGAPPSEFSHPCRVHKAPAGFAYKMLPGLSLRETSTHLSPPNPGLQGGTSDQEVPEALI